MKKGRLRTMSICLDDIESIPQHKIYVAANKKRYISLATWDYSDEQLKNSDHDFSLSVFRTDEEKKAGEPIHWLGGGIIHDKF